MTDDMIKDELEVGAVITLDDEDGEEIGEFEVLELFDVDGKQYAALTPFVEEEPAEGEDDVLDIFLFGVVDGELVGLEQEEEERAFSKLKELATDIDFHE